MTFLCRACKQDLAQHARSSRAMGCPRPLHPPRTLGCGCVTTAPNLPADFATIICWACAQKGS